MQEKTNVMRILDKAKLPYKEYTYDGGALSGTEVAKKLSQDEKKVFKTLVTVSKSLKNYVFMIPVAEICARRVLAHRHEKAVSHDGAQQCKGSRHRYFQRRKNRLSGGTRRFGSSENRETAICRRYMRSRAISALFAKGHIKRHKTRKKRKA